MTRQPWRPGIFEDRSDETGATAIEYGFLASLIAVVIIAGVSLVGERLLAIFDSILTWF